MIRSPAPEPCKVLASALVRAAWIALPVLLSACTGDAIPEDAADASGRLVIVGGALQRDNVEIYRSVLEATEGEGPFCVIPTASGVPEESMASAVEAFTEHGAQLVDGIFITTDNPEAASDPGIAERLRGCSGFWFVGGSQSRVVEVFLPEGRSTPAYDAVIDRYRAGAVVAGSSAGAAIMSPTMIAGGSSAGALAGGVLEVAPDEDAEIEGVLTELGMGFHNGPVFDQHFLARGRIGRLLVATLAGVGGGVGFGIDENTALVVDGRMGRVSGASGVVLVDARNALGSERGHGGAGVRVHLMGRDDQIDMNTLAVTAPREKQPVPAGAEPLVAPDDPFARWSFLHLLHAFAGSDMDRVTMDAHGYEITLERGSTFRALAYGEDGVEGTPAGLSVGPISLSLELLPALGP